MPQQNCTVPGCPNKGKYCRLHQVETFKPAVNKIETESDKRKKLNKTYRKEAKAFLSLHPKCQVKGCNKVSECVHHKAGRIGELLMNKLKWLAVCLGHHRQIEDNPDWAKQEGYSESRLKS